VKPDFSNININNFSYPLTDEKIAKFPLGQRDESKLLIHSNGKISESHFKNLAGYLPADSFLVLNNTKVVRARLFFRKPTGAIIEIFCLEPIEPTTEIQLAFQQKGSSVWKCLVGNARRWKGGTLTSLIEHNDEKSILSAGIKGKAGDAFLINFNWQPDSKTFAEILEQAGKIPLPPYLHREAVESDKVRYQTVYALNDGSVAAPTAGLHFTGAVFDSLSQKKITYDYLTLHVGAGTFKPVGDDGIANHEMHTEQVLVSRQLIEKLRQKTGKVIVVGTTSVRALESIYWFGVKLETEPGSKFDVRQFDPYGDLAGLELPTEKALQNVLDHLEKEQSSYLSCSTQLMIIPGYKFRMINGMVTNFHQPRSTLLLLIAAFLGDKWREIYDYALENDFRFLSYGDSCLFL
jgi:S-adenosylmethionine:tRNA ribosyltransferase-isomerase